MKSKVPTWLLSLAALWASGACGQTHAQDAFSDCPAFPAETATSLRWEVLRIPNMLLCRAMRTDDATEAFAMTISPESPFKPRRGDRAEVGNLNGRTVQWYRGIVPNEPDVLIRETLIEVRKNLVIHIFMRAKDAETLAQHQQFVLSLPIPPPTND
ncbi:MAG: hypothetical protein HOP03_00905 [Lysobacter sp.]|nr:hypothetical protein [Lysobacter sp.]